jgi:hypothetical protein
MEKFPNETLENAIDVYETFIKVIEDSGDTDYCNALDKVTVAFLKELKAYRDAEEQGLLLRLMCDAGDKVYYPCFIDSRVIDFEIVEIKIYEDEIIYIDDGDNEWHEYDLGKTIFLTKEEAEQKLAEMKGE